MNTAVQARDALPLTLEDKLAAAHSALVVIDMQNDFWDPRINVAGADDPGRRIAYQDSVLPVVEAGQAQLVDGLHAIDDQLLVEPAPGHTPGHILLKLAAAGRAGVFCGDVLHHPLQIYAPHWNSQFCELPDEARATRRKLLEHCAEKRALLFPTHFGAPHVAAIAAQAGGFAARFVTGTS
jgi:glyoxylase-like metal-dependent hydrolase (beta-lactamase superfamily II)